MVEDSKKNIIKARPAAFEPKVHTPTDCFSPFCLLYFHGMYLIANIATSSQQAHSVCAEAALMQAYMLPICAVAYLHENTLCHVHSGVTHYSRRLAKRVL